MRRWALVIATAALLAVPASADWKDMAGRRVPDITASDWMNTGKQTPSTASLRGKAILLEFYATW